MLDKITDRPVHSKDIMVKFTAFQSIKVTEPKIPKPQDDALERKVFWIIKENSQIIRKILLRRLDH